MIVDNKKTSLLVTEQLPEFIRDNPDYANFSLFLKSYYEWMEQSGQVTEGSKNLLSYKDIDRTANGFLEYFTNDFLPNFPKETLIDEKQAVKLAKELYSTKGTPSSYAFLFKILFNSEFEYFNTKDAVLRASDGIWYVAKSLKLNTTDERFLNIDNYRVIGETTKSIATIENTVFSGTKVEVYISNIERLFQSGEFIRVVDNNNQDVIIDGQNLRAKVVGQVSQLKIDPKARGLLYKVGDPVIVYNGLSSNTGIEATAEVGSTTKGSIQAINVVTGGFGYNFTPNTRIDIVGDGLGANAVVGSVNPDVQKRANVTMLPIDSITLSRFTRIGNTSYSFLSGHPSANANTSLANAFSFIGFTTYPLSSVLVENGGGGFSTVPSVSAVSTYETDLGNWDNLSKMGILSPIQIAAGGHGYRANYRIIISGGTGTGAYANVIAVSSSGAITNVAFVYDTAHPNSYPLGGLGYRVTGLPTLTVQSANNQAANASLYTPGILGSGASFSVIVDRAGSVTTIKLLTSGEDYVTTPNVSLKVQDIVVSNVSILSLPQKGDAIYQGSNVEVASYRATVNSISLLQPYNDPTQSLYNLRVFNYTSNPDPKQNLKIDRNLNFVLANTAFDTTYNQNGIKNYGDGSAKGTASFLNGLALSQGQYLNAQGQPSSYSVLQSEKYNNYTYQITVEKEIEKYRNVLLNLLHPSGMKLIGRMTAKVPANFDYHVQESLYTGRPFYASEGGIGAGGATATIVTDFTNKSNNIVKFNNLLGANIANLLFANTTTLSLQTDHGVNVMADILAVNYLANTVTISSNVWLTYANVATITGTSGSNTINITEVITDSYNVINNGVYSNTAYPLKDIVFAGDKILVANNTQKTVESIDYENGIIYLTSNLSTNANSLMSVNRTFVANSSIQSNQIKIYGPVGTTYIPELITENGQTIVTEDDRTIILG
jgi:hypothetical protein